ncbi:permease [Clostridiaceae bacterium M8S5]|nr:permease [Clostridiaceae bacterium M8S5]
MKQKIMKNKILLIAIIGYIVLFVYNMDMGRNALKISGSYLIEMVKILPAIFIITSIIQTWVPTRVIINNFGSGSGVKGKMISFAIGSLSAGPIYAAFPVCRMLIDKGASVENVIIILSSWAVIKVPMLINEAKFMTVKYMIVRWIFTTIAIIAMGSIMKLWVKKDEILKHETKISNDKLYINKNTCIGCGNCVKKYPKLFKLVNGKAAIIDNQNIIRDEIIMIKQSCPLDAIS